MLHNAMLQMQQRHRRGMLMFTSNNWILFYASLMFIGSAIFSYSKTLKDTVYFTVYMLATALLGSWLWVVASRRIVGVADQLWYSLVWDTLMMGAFYGVPLLCFEHKLTWQSWSAITLIVVGMLWFKTSTGVTNG